MYASTNSVSLFVVNVKAKVVRLTISSKETGFIQLCLLVFVVVALCVLFAVIEHLNHN